MIKLWHRMMHGGRFDPLGSRCRYCRRERWELIFRMQERRQVTWDGVAAVLRCERPHPLGLCTCWRSRSNWNLDGGS